MKKVYSFTTLILAVFLLSVTETWGQTTQTYSTVGSYTWTAPAGVTGVTIEAWGGGGAGGGAYGAFFTRTAGGGGAGGVFTRGYITTPNDSYSVVVGAGGTGTSNANGTAGSPSSFGTITAAGGNFGLRGTTSNQNGNGGAAATSGGTFYGGSGRNGNYNSSYSGGGGGGPSNSNNGSPSTTVTGGAGGTNGIVGGKGGDGFTGSGSGSIGNGSVGEGLGAGGGGAYSHTGSGSAGGNGYRGQVIVYYYQLTAATSVNSPVCLGSSATVTITSPGLITTGTTYTVTYNLSAPNAATGRTATVTVETSGSGTFTVPSSALTNSGTTTVTVTDLTNGTYRGSFGDNNTANIVVNTPSTDPVSITGTSGICSGSSTTLTTSGGSLGTDAEDVWYEGGCATEIFTNEWQSQPYTTDGTTVNSYNGILNVTSTNADPMIHMENIGSYNTALYSYMQIRYRVVSGTAGSVQIYYSKNGGGDLSETQVVVADLTSDNSWHVVNVNMSASPNWTGNITGWRFDWCSASGVTMDIDFITLADRPILEVGTSVTVSPLETTTYYTRKKGACNSTSCISQVVTVNKPGATIGCPIDIGVLGCTPYTDTQNNSTANGFGNDYTGTNNQASDDIFYRFELAAASTVEISTCESPFDSYIHLLNGSGVLISENDNPGPVCQNVGAASIRQYDLAAGIYYVVVEGWSTEAGDIPLRINLLPSGNVTADDYSICNGSDVTFTYTSSGGWAFSNFQYQMDGTAGIWNDWPGTNPYTWTAGNPGHAFFVRAKASNGSCDSYTVPMIVVVNPSSGTAPAITATPATINPGETVTLSVSDASLGVYYKFTSDINDYSGNGLNLTGPTPTFSDGGLELSSGTSFNSGTTSILNTNNYTISFSMKMTADNHAKQLFAFAPAGYDRSPGIWFFNNQFYWRENSTTSPPGDLGVDLYGIPAFVVGTWYDITGEKKGNVFTLYVNGVQRATGAVPDPKAPGDAELHFGDIAGGAPDGASVVIKEFKIYPGTVRWYSGSCGGTPEGIGLSVTKTPSSSVTYFVRTENSCYDSDCSSWSVNANWLGGTPGDVNNWDNPLNWFGGAIPVAGTDVIIPSGVDQPVISASTEAQCNNLIINPGASLTIQSSVNSSGSLIVNGTATGNVTYNRVMPADLYRYVSSPVVSATLPSGTDFWKWNEEIGYWGDTSEELQVTACETGRGYTMLASGTGVTFTGGVLTTSATVTATAPYGSNYEQNRGTWGGGGWNLLGNPYPSALRVVDSDGTDDNDFIHYNLSSFDPSYQAIYIYDGADYDYIALDVPGFPGGMGEFLTDDIQAGQGFFVLTHYTGLSFTFMPEMRTHNTTAVMTKSGSVPWPGVQLKVKSGSAETATLVAYGEGMSAGLDPGYDVGHLSSGSGLEVYTLLSGGGSDFNFARQALPLSEAGSTVVPVGLDFPGGGEVTFSAFTIPLEGKNFWLEDRTAKTFTELNTNSYTVTLPANTYGTGRFFIIASVNTPTGIGQPEADDGRLKIWSSGGRVIIQGEVSEGSLCEIYKINGTKIMAGKLTGGEMNTVDLPSDSRDVYLVRVIDGLKVTIRKVIVF